MALFTDGPPSTLEELTALDSQLLDVAHVEGIDVTQKLALAHEELRLELTSELTRRSNFEQSIWASNQVRLDSVVVTPALRLWHAYRSLELVYRDAYNNQLNDRYAGKRDQFHQMSIRSYDQLATIGLGITTNPIPRAQTPGVTAGQSPSGMNLMDGTYYVAMAWTNAVGEEGAASDPVSVATAASTFLVTAGDAPDKAVGWNVYGGTDPNSLTRQNDAAIGLGVTWVQPGPLSSSGRMRGNGQAPNYERPLPRLIQRG